MGLCNLLSMAEVNKQDLSGKPDTQLEEGINLEPWTRTLLFAICKLYFTNYYLSRRGAKYHPVLIGSKENIQVTLDIFRWLTDSIKKESNRTYQSPSLRKSFRLGAAKSVLRRSFELLEAEKFKGQATGTALVVLRNELEKSNTQFLDSLDLGKFVPRRATVNQSAYASGTAFGNNMPLAPTKTIRG